MVAQNPKLKPYIEEIKNNLSSALKEEPKDAEVISHKLMVRAGMIKKLASGVYSYLPMGYRVS